MKNRKLDSPSTRTKLTDAERNKRFVETAKKVEASENLEDFDRAFSSIDIKLSDRHSRPSVKTTSS